MEHDSNTKQAIRNVSSGPLVCHSMRLRPGQEVMRALLEFVEDHRLPSAFILTCVGSVKEVKLRMADSSKIEIFKGPFEIVSLVGTLSAGGHVHGSFGDAEGHVIGGHVIGDMWVYTTAEIMVGEVGNTIFSRKPDEQTGWDELVIRPNKN
ncbi:hypothetical protein ScPMuIL_013795 [Solemya velum]